MAGLNTFDFARLATLLSAAQPLVMQQETEQQAAERIAKQKANAAAAGLNQLPYEGPPPIAVNPPEQKGWTLEKALREFMGPKPAY